MPVAEVTDLLRQLRSASGMLERGRVMVRAASVFGSLSPDERRVVARALAEQGAPGIGQQLEDRSGGRIPSTQVRAISDGLLEMDDNQIDELTAKLSNRQEVGRLAIEVVEEGQLPTSPPSGPPVEPPNAPPTGPPSAAPTGSPVSPPEGTFDQSRSESSLPPSAQSSTPRSSGSGDAVSDASGASGASGGAAAATGAAAAAGTAGASAVAAQAARSTDADVPDQTQAAQAKVKQELANLDKTDDLQLDDFELEAPSLGEAALGEASLGEAGLGEVEIGEADLGDVRGGEADGHTASTTNAESGSAEPERAGDIGAEAAANDDTASGATAERTPADAAPEQTDAEIGAATGEPSAQSDSATPARTPSPSSTATTSTSPTSTSATSRSTAIPSTGVVLGDAAGSAGAEAVRKRLENVASATDRLRIVADEASTVAGAGWLELLGLIPEGWQRRRAAERLVEANRFPVFDLETAFKTLGNDRDATFVASALIAASAIDAAQLRGILDDRTVDRLALRARR